MELKRKSAVRLAPKEGWRARISEGQTATLKVSARSTGGAYALFEVEAEPGERTPAHIQHREDECLYVIEGEFEFSLEEGSVEASPGTVFYIPKGSLHSYENVGNVLGRLVMIHTPGGPHERFFEELRNVEEPLEAERVAGMAAAQGIEVVPRNVPEKEGQNRDKRLLRSGRLPA